MAGGKTSLTTLKPDTRAYVFIKNKQPSNFQSKFYSPGSLLEFENHSGIKLDEEIVFVRVPSTNRPNNRRLFRDKNAIPPGRINSGNAERERRKSRDRREAIR